MAARVTVRALPGSLLQPVRSNSYICRPCLLSQQQQQQNQRRSLHQNNKAIRVPEPTPFVPDVSTFLTLIGRGLSTHAAKITSWESLFKLSGAQLKELGIEPARTRRYLLNWREKFRKGEYGIGGDFKHVVDGIGELRVLEVPALHTKENSTSTDINTMDASEYGSTSRTPGMQKLVLNTPKDTSTISALLSKGQTTADLKKPAHIALKDGHVIAGSYVQPLKGSNGSAAMLKVTEGMWEHKRGRKIHGGERRRAETLHKMRVEERKKNER